MSSWYLASCHCDSPGIWKRPLTSILESYIAPDSVPRTTDLLPRITKIINTSYNQALPKAVTPNEIWFSYADIDWLVISEKRQRENTYQAETIARAYDNPLPLISEDEEEINKNNNRDKEEEVHKAIVLSALYKRVKEN